ncbi:probable ALA1 - alanyl-tRNA synthetase, cytosolic [Ustilago trichophora]|uniref:Alanine--tRNA ligase n=1 Tax=Ustilago trichophora TaxID=86804 RepID=A0A5C3E611_9BASI|nr:probable ALA1 - alanyl-tRNA synthetase, cytosolic [Ustilago trichophora]
MAETQQQTAANNASTTSRFGDWPATKYKPIFLGIADPNSSFGSMKRAVNSQKCIRAGGKHNDLDDVGKDTYHHTFFEMLGNWSFGDYFKKEAIEMAWELLTVVYGLPKDRLYVTYFEGDAKQGLEPDLEARDLWLKDWRPQRFRSRQQGRPNVIEIWNNVFMQFNREDDGSLRPLPAKHIDTGMGFERLVSILKTSPPTTIPTSSPPSLTRSSSSPVPVLTPASSAPRTRMASTLPTVSLLTTSEPDFCHLGRRCADRDGRGYVLRRILRRGTRYVRKYFQVPIGSFFSQLVPTLVDQMGHFFPEITKKVNDVKAILDEEEASFARTLDRGEKLFEEYAAKAKADGKKQLSGNDVWKLYDTFGFPVDLTLIMAEEQGLGVNEKEFEAAQAESKELSKAGGKKGETEAVKFDVHDLGHLEKDSSVPKTQDDFKYGVNSVKASVKAIYQDHAFFPETTKIGDRAKNFGILLDRTCLYAESGGQQADTGSIVIDGKTEFVIEDAQVLGDHIDQKGSLVAPTKLRFDFSHKQGVNVTELKKIEDISVDWIKRDVGVYSKEMSLEVAQKIPGLRAVFGEAYPNPVRVVTLEYDLDTIAGDLENPKWRGTSVEFCGGTHVAKTGDIRQFVITEESGIAKGIRRIIAVTGDEAASVTKVADDAESRLGEIDAITDQSAKDAALKAYGTNLAQLDISVVRKASLNEKFSAIRKKLDTALKAQDKADTKLITDSVVSHFQSNPNATSYIAKFDVGSNMKALQSALNVVKKLDKTAYFFSQQLDPNGTKIADGNALKAKVVHVAYVSKYHQSKGLNAKEWVETAAQHVGGKGGGKKDSAQGVGEMGGKALDDAIESAKRVFTLKCEDSPVPMQ